MEAQKSRKYTKETPWPHLRQEIIQEILVRLPVKSLLRLSCVSKPWRAIISSDGFIKAHLEKSSNNRSFEHHRIILGKYIVQANRCFLPSFSHKPLAAAVNFDYPTCGSNYGRCRIFGSCDGVVCFYKNSTKDFVLWNPSTRKFKQLPPIIIDDSERDYCVLRTAGFGFVESNDDYKVFVKLINPPCCAVERTELVKTYSLKTDSWKKVGVFAFDSCSEKGAGIYVSGKLHWNRYGLDGLVQGIISFDLENEIFGTVEWPNGVDRCFLGPEKIDGCLCCISPNDSKPDDNADYWLLKEYGVNDSWHKFATLERPLFAMDDGGRYDYEYFVPVFVGANGDILCWEDVVDYDFCTIFFKKKDGFLESYVRHLYSTHFPPVVYFESLVGL